MTVKRHQRMGWRGSFLFVLALLASVGPSWAANYVCPMMRAESHLPACCAHRLAAADATTPEAFQVACHCPIPNWQAGAMETTRSLTVPASQVQVVADLPSLARPIQVADAFAVLPLSRPPARSGPALWVRNQAILC